MPHLVKKIPNGLYDIVGDVHGEHEALLNLMLNLGYDADGNHPKGRKLIFIGDLCDRGPDSPAVIFLVQKLVNSGAAFCILGNHEMNILMSEPRDGSSWFFESRVAKEPHYLPYVKPDLDVKNRILDFFKTLPIALESDDLRIAHAAWDTSHIETLSKYPLSSLKMFYSQVERDINKTLENNGVLEKYFLEEEKWGSILEDRAQTVSEFLHNIAEYHISHQMLNPFKVIMSGTEAKTTKPFYVGGKWRFSKRSPWWDTYIEDKPVIIGHYWRKINDDDNKKDIAKGMFTEIPYNSWHGYLKNVFCVDYSVGARFQERNGGFELGSKTKLAALNWPERTITLEDGVVFDTINFRNQNPSSDFKTHHN